MARTSKEQPTPVTVINNIDNHNNRHLGTKARLGMAAAVAVGAAAFVLWPKGESETTSIQSAKVTRVYPEAIDLRATVIAKIESKASLTPGNDPLDRGLDHVPVFGWLNKKLNATEGLSSTFTGPQGKGGGEVASLVGVKSKGEEVTTRPNGHVTFKIPAKNIVLITAINEANSEVTVNNGTGAALGSALLKALPGTESIQRKNENTQAQLNQDAIKNAANEMQQSCDKKAWPLAVQAITRADVSIALHDNMVERSSGENLSILHPNQISVQITGGLPSFPEAYSMPEHSTEALSLSKQPKVGCEVAPNALDLNSSYADTHGDPLSSDQPG